MVLSQTQDFKMKNKKMSQSGLEREGNDRDYNELDEALLELKEKLEKEV